MALNYLTETKGIPHNRIILYGRSLGGGPATDLASRFPVGGLILEQTFASVYRTVLPSAFYLGTTLITFQKSPRSSVHYSSFTEARITSSLQRMDANF